MKLLAANIKPFVAAHGCRRRGVALAARSLMAGVAIVLLAATPVWGQSEWSPLGPRREAATPLRHEVSLGLSLTQGWGLQGATGWAATSIQVNPRLRLQFGGAKATFSPTPVSRAPWRHPTEAKMVMAGGQYAVNQHLTVEGRLYLLQSQDQSRVRVGLRSSQALAFEAGLEYRPDDETALALRVAYLRAEGDMSLMGPTALMFGHGHHPLGWGWGYEPLGYWPPF
ncbi:MAG: hypothetical protein IJ789_00450 [Bacteroidales bacterium]|nr:hypothetical protein [Bacteroidales bacterium]